jgi:hypothetical protein
VTVPGTLDDGSPRVIVQLLEGGAASGAISPDAAVARLREAGLRLPISDICLGWGLPLATVEAVAGEARRQAAALWLWHPFLAGDGRYLPGPDRALGPAGTAVPAPGGLGEFTFDCPLRPTALAAALARLEEALGRHAWDGVLLDKIRWPSPSADPANDLACFCDACRAAASAEGVDLTVVAQRLARASGTPAGRLDLVRALLHGADDEHLSAFLTWRCRRITDAVQAASRLIAGRQGPDGGPLRLALDVFAPALSRAVGQDIGALAPLAELTKGMLYLGTHGPAGLSYELCRLARWLAAGGVPSPTRRLAELTGVALPGLERLCTGSLDGAVFESELAALRRLAGRGAAAGIDAVAIAELAVLGDAVLEEAVEAAVGAGVPIVLSWDLMAIPDERLARVAAPVERAS